MKLVSIDCILGSIRGAFKNLVKLNGKGVSQGFALKNGINCLTREKRKIKN